jgi:hypothetical protein
MAGRFPPTLASPAAGSREMTGEVVEAQGQVGGVGRMESSSGRFSMV